MYALCAISITLLTIALVVMVIFNFVARYGGCGWGGRGACAKCDRSVNICLFTGWPMCTIMICMLVSIVVLSYIAPPKPVPSGYVGTMTQTEYNTFAKMNGLDGSGNKEPKPEPEPKPTKEEIVANLDTNGVCRDDG